MEFCFGGDSRAAHGECARADYHARFVAEWNHQKLFGERRRQDRVAS